MPGLGTSKSAAKLSCPRCRLRSYWIIAPSAMSSMACGGLLPCVLSLPFPSPSNHFSIAFILLTSFFYSSGSLRLSLLFPVSTVSSMHHPHPLLTPHYRPHLHPRPYLYHSTPLTAIPSRPPFLRSTRHTHATLVFFSHVSSIRNPQCSVRILLLFPFFLLPPPLFLTNDRFPDTFLQLLLVRLISAGVTSVLLVILVLYAA